MTLHCTSNRTQRSHPANIHRLESREIHNSNKPSVQRQAEEALLRRIKCHLLTELDKQTQTHLKIYVSLAMPITLPALANDITFYIDDQPHTLRATDLGGSGLPEENNWLTTVYRGTAFNGVTVASVSLGCS